MAVPVKAFRPLRNGAESGRLPEVEVGENMGGVPHATSMRRPCAGIRRRARKPKVTA